MDDRLADHRVQAGHPIRKPFWDMSTVQGKIGGPSSSSHQSSYLPLRDLTIPLYTTSTGRFPSRSIIPLQRRDGSAMFVPPRPAPMPLRCPARASITPHPDRPPPFLGPEKSSDNLARGTNGSNPCTLQSGHWLVGIVDWPNLAGLPGVACESCVLSTSNGPAPRQVGRDGSPVGGCASSASTGIDARCGGPDGVMRE